MTGIGVLLLALLVLGLGQSLGLSLLLRLGYLLLFLVVGAFVWARYNVTVLRFSRQSGASRLAVGDDVEETMTLENRGFLPILWVEIRDQSDLPGHNLGRVLPLAPRRTVPFLARSTCTLRGRYWLGPVIATAGDPLGLFSFRRQFGPALSLTVYPRAAALEQVALPLAELLGPAALDRRGQPAGADAFSIRDYVPGDPLNRVDWKATARQQQLMVKEYEAEHSAVIWLVLDLQAREHVARWEGRTVSGERGPLPHAADSTEEYAVEATAALARRFLESGYSVGLVASAASPRLLSPDRSPYQLERVLEVLALVRADGDIPLASFLASESAHFTSRDVLVAITPSASPDWPVLLSELQDRGTRSLAVFVDPASFDAERRSGPKMGFRSSGRDLPIIEVRRGQDVAAALAQVA